VQGPRAALAQELGRANRDWTPVATATAGALDLADGGGAMAQGDPTKQRRSDAQEKEARAGVYRVRSGDSLIAIAEGHAARCRAGEGQQAQGARLHDQARPAPQARGCDD
jgi:hypothetical protein